jgi:hypothetical protein
MSNSHVKYLPDYKEYEQVLHWLETNDTGEMPEKFAQWLEIWRVADNLIAKGTMRLETVAKMLTKEFPELTLKTAWSHVTNAMNYYNSTANISKDTRRRYVTRLIEKVIAILYEQLPKNPRLSKEIAALIREIAEIEGLKDHSTPVDPNLFQQNIIVFDIDATKHGFPEVPDDEVKKMFKKWIKKGTITEAEFEIINDEYTGTR